MTVKPKLAKTALKLQVFTVMLLCKFFPLLHKFKALQAETLRPARAHMRPEPAT